MKKSPLSTGSGSRGKESYNRRSYDHKNKTGYNSVASDYLCFSPTVGQVHSGGDFIPLNVSTPVSEHKRFNGNWHGSGGNRNYRNSGSSGFNHYRNKYSGKQFYGQKKGYQKDAQRHINISSYIDMKSFLEDPWADLVKKFNKSEDVNRGTSSKCDQLLLVQSTYRNSETDFKNKSVVDADSSCFSQESGNESSINVTLGLDDTDISSVSHTKSSIDLKLDNMRFSRESKDKSNCSNNDTACEDVRKENNIRHSCDSQTKTIQVI